MSSFITSGEPWAGVSEKIRNVWTADSLRGRFARGAVWSLIGAALGQGANLAASVVAARLMGREQFGQYGIIQSTVGMLGTFAGLGLGMTATKFVAEFRTRDPKRAGRIIVLSSLTSVISGTILGVLLLSYAPLIAANTLNAPPLSTELRIASLLLCFNAVNGAQAGALSGLEAFRSIARINLARGLVTFPITVFAILLWKLPGSIWALSTSAAITCLLTQVSLRKWCAAAGIQLRLSSAWSERAVLWSFSTPAFLSGTLIAPVLWAANTILVNQHEGYAEMGVFSAASQWRNAIAFVPAAIAQFALPILSNLNGGRDTLRYRRALHWNLAITTTVSLAAAVPVAAASQRIMSLYGNEFQHGWLVLVLLSATAVLSSINGVVGTAILSAGSAWTGLLFNAMWASVLLCGCWYSVPAYLSSGVAGSMLVAYLAHTGWQMTYLQHKLSKDTVLA